MSRAECGAAAILTPGGPARISFELCCVLATLHATGPTPTAFVCAAGGGGAPADAGDGWEAPAYAAVGCEPSADAVAGRETSAGAGDGDGGLVPPVPVAGATW